ncbi:MAG: hypothetical protein WDN69_23385 [Aliidongia sp.]
MTTQKFGFALFAGLAFSVLTLASVNAETIEVVGSANGCSTSYQEMFAADGSPVNSVIMSCPRLPLQIARAPQ